MNLFSILINIYLSSSSLEALADTSTSEVNMKLFLAITIWIWCGTVGIALAAAPSWPQITFDLTGDKLEDYSKPMRSLRDQVKSSVLKHKVPVLKPPSSTAWDFVLVNLKASESKTITLAINVTNLYLVAYLDKYGGKDRAHFFPSIPKEVKKTVFTDATQADIHSNENYGDLENKAGQKRENIELGIKKLDFEVQSVYGKDVKTSGFAKQEAKFLIIAIQMISEAARFKYIENKVEGVGFYGGYKPDPKAISLENSWAAISKAFNSREGSIIPPLRLKDANNKDWIVTWVGDLVPDVALLLYVEEAKATVSQVLSQLIRSIVQDNDGEWKLIPSRRAFPFPK